MSNLAAEQTAITATLATFITGSNHNRLPPNVISGAKRSLVDAVGVAVAGSRQPGPAILSKYVRQLEARPKASVIGCGFKSAPDLAAWVNGTSADVLGWADFSVAQMNHPSAAIGPAVLALGEAENSSGRDILLSYIIGVEVSNKLAQGVKPHFHTKGWHALGVCNTFGATAAASRLLGLDSIATANALGIAGAEASGMKASMVSMAKSYVSGAGARNGIQAAMLARRGYTGPTNVIEGQDGFLQTFGGGVDGSGILRNLGSPFEFASPGLTLKLYPSCTHTHTAIVAALRLKDKHGITAEQVESVTCSVTPVVYDFLAWPSPENSQEAKFSMQFCVATALLHESVELRHFTDDAIWEPRTAALMKRIAMVISPEFAALGYNPPVAPSGCIMTVQLKNGASYTERVDKGPWEPPVVPTWEALLLKFIGATAQVLDASRANAAFEMVRDIEQISRIDGLMNVLRA